MSIAVKRVAALLSVPESFVVELREAGVVELTDDLVTEHVHFEHVVERVRICWTLHDELGVNLAGIEVALHLLSIIERDRRFLADR